MKSLVLLTNSILAVAILSGCSQTSTTSSSSPATDDFNLQCSDSSGHCQKIISNSTDTKFLTNRTYHPFLSTRSALYITAKNTLYSVSSPDGALTAFATYTPNGGKDAYFFNPFLLGHYIVMSALVDKIRQFAYVDLNSNDKKIILADKATTGINTTLLTPVVQGNKAYYPTYKDTKITIQTIDASNDITFSDTTGQVLPDSELTSNGSLFAFGGVQFSNPLQNFCTYSFGKQSPLECDVYNGGKSAFLILNSIIDSTGDIYYGDGYGEVVSKKLKTNLFTLSNCGTAGCSISGIGKYNNIYHVKTNFNSTDRGSFSVWHQDSTDTAKWIGKTFTATGPNNMTGDFVPDLVYNGKNLYVFQGTTINLFDASSDYSSTENELSPVKSMTLDPANARIIATPILSNDKNSLYVVTEDGTFHIINLAKAGLLLPQ